MDSNSTPANVGSNDGLGLVTKRAGLRTDANVAIWGCIVCASVWSASAHPLGTWFAAGWLICSVVILWIERCSKDDKA